MKNTSKIHVNQIKTKNTKKQEQKKLFFCLSSNNNEVKSNGTETDSDSEI